MSGEFPEPPNGSPGGVRSAARSIGRAGEALADVGSGLKGASGALAADWHGWAAQSYQSCVTGLAGPVRNGVDQFQACEKAIMSFADALEHAQDEIKRLHGLWVDAKAREAAALSQVNALSTQLATAKPKEAPAIQDSLSTASSTATTAGGEAAQLVIKANGVLEEFKAEAASQAEVLSGTATFIPGMGLGAGVGLFSSTASALNFGVPRGGLDPLRGVITVHHPNRTAYEGPGEYLLSGGPFGDDTKTEESPYRSTNIPGYTNFYDRAFGHHDAVQADNSLINPVELLLLATGAGFAARKALGEAAKGIAKGTGFAGTEKAAQEAAKKAFDDVLENAKPNHVAFVEKLKDAREAAFAAKTRVELEALERRAQTAEQVLEGLDKARVPLPPGADKLIPYGMRTQEAYRGYVIAKLMEVRTRAARLEGKTAERVVKMIDRALGNK